MIELEDFKKMIGVFIEEQDSEIQREEQKLQKILSEAKKQKKEVSDKKEKRRQQMIMDIGIIAEQTGILLVDRDILRGAFQAIKKAVETSEVDRLQEWKQVGSSVKG